MRRDCPVDVISVCNADGSIYPLRVQLEDEHNQRLRFNIQEVIKVKEIPYVGVEAHIYVCRARIHSRELVFELKYTFRTHTWCLVWNIQ